MASLPFQQRFLSHKPGGFHTIKIGEAKTGVRHGGRVTCAGRTCRCTPTVASADPSLDPGLRRGERLKGMFSIKSAHTGEGRYPGDHLQTSAGPSLVPGLRREEQRKAVFFQLNPLIPAEAGIQEIIPKPRRASPWTPAYAGVSGFYVGYQLHPLIPAKAGIQGIIPTLSRPIPGPRRSPG